MLINEKGKFVKDGVYITYYSHLNRDDYQVKVIVNGEIVKSGEETLDEIEIKEDALKFKSEYNLPIYDARGLVWSVFSHRYLINNMEGDFGNRFSDIAEKLIFTEEDKENLDQRPILTCKWAFYQGESGRFKIYEKRSKIEADLYDTELYRGLYKQYRVEEQVRDMSNYISDKEMYEGTFESFINEKFVIIINGRLYHHSSTEFRELIIFVSKNDFNPFGEYPIELKRDEDGDKKYLDLGDVRMSWSEEELKYQNSLQMLYDAYCIVGKESQFPNNIKLCYDHICERNMVLAIKNDKCRVIDEKKLEMFNNLKRGDIIARMSCGTECDYMIVLGTDNWKLQVSDVEKIINVSDYWYVPRYLVSKEKCDEALDGKSKVRSIDVTFDWHLSNKKAE